MSGDPLKQTLGVCYYPEHWPEKDWQTDAARMVEAGLTWVRIGEFAWSRYEQKPGVLTWDWLDRAIDVLGTAGLKVVLGTPTATPPRWMLDKHPDMLAYDDQGRARKFGSRRHYCFSHDGYREESRRIASLMAQRYGRNPYVAAWQTDNEYDCHDTAISYSPNARIAFQDWCAQRYQSTDALNRAWGNMFWSMDYDSFYQIDLPNLTVTEPNPAHVLAFRRFSSDQVVRFNRAQCEAIRAHSAAPIIHNFMGRITAFDHYKVGADLDIASWDSYPMGFLLDRVDAPDAHKQTYIRQGDPDFQAFHHDLYRACGGGRWWVMEQQPGPVNWAPWNPAPLPGMCRLWAWEAFAHGAEAVLYFRWRQAPIAQEQHHAGLLRPDSAPAPALAEAAQVAKELAALPAIKLAPAKVALVFDYDSAFMWEAQPQGADFNYFNLVFATYRALRRCGVAIDVVASNADLTGYRHIYAPGLAHLPDTWSAPQDAQLTIGPRAGAKTDEMSIPIPLPPQVPGFQGIVSHVESLPPSVRPALQNGGYVTRWTEALEADGEIVEATQDGTAIAVRQGNITYLAAWLDDTALLRRVMADLGIPKALPDGLRMRPVQGGRILWNYGAEPVAWQGLSLPPAGVLFDGLA